MHIFGVEITGDHARLAVAVFGGLFAAAGFLVGRWSLLRSRVAFRHEDLVTTTCATELYGFQHLPDGRVRLSIVTQGSAEPMAQVFTNANLIRHIQREAKKHPGLLRLADKIAHRMMMDEGKDRITGLDPRANLDFVQGRPVREDEVLFGFAAYSEDTNGDGEHRPLRNEVARLIQMVVSRAAVPFLADPGFVARLQVEHAGYRPRIARLHDFALEWQRLEALPSSNRSAAVDKIWVVTVRTALA